MTMTATEINAALLDFANQYCKREWIAQDAPPAVNLFIEKAAAFLGNVQGLQSKRLGDVSWVYTTEFPAAILGLLNPFRRVTFT